MKQLQTAEDVEAFMLTHGEKIVDSLGEEVDRIEKILKVFACILVC
jgi:zinc transporter 9